MVKPRSSFRPPLGLLLLLAVAPLAAQTPAQFHVTARLVAVPVTVLNGHGQFVTGLQRGDFQLRVDGHPTPIVAIDASGSGSPPPNPYSWPAALPAKGINNRPRTSAGGHVVLVFDADGIPITALPVLRRQLGQAFGQPLPPGVDVGIFRFGAGLQLVQPFTSQNGQLMTVLRRLLATPQTLMVSLGGEAEAIDNAVAVSGASLPAPPSGGGQLGAALAAVMQAFAQAQARMLSPARRAHFYQRINELRMLAQVLEGIPGHKEVLWFSTDPSGTAAAPGSGLSSYAPPARRSRLFVGEVSDMFNAANASLYIINPNGLRIFAAGAGAAGVPNSALDMTSLITSQVALASSVQVAERTGGTVMAQRNDLGHLARQTVARLGEQYTLYFAPDFPFRRAAQYHRIQVRVLRPGLKIWYRHGYQQRRRNISGVSAHLLATDLEVRQWATSPMDFRAVPLALIPGDRTGPMPPYWPGAKHRKPIEELPFTLLIPAGRLLHRASHGDYLYDFSVEVITIAAQSGQTARLPADHFRSHFGAWQAAALDGTPIHYRGRFVLPVHGACLARVVVRDNVTGALGSVTVLVR
ncbi:MAG: VWA domain-containing protein [Terriglobales bacterium]